MRVPLPAVLLVALALAGCAAAAPAQTAVPPPAAASRGEPESVEEAQRQIAELRRDLGLATGDASDAKDARKEGPARAPAAASSPQGGAGGGPEGPRTADPPAKAGSGAASEAAASGPSCATPCRAVASMRRAVGSLCRLAGESDTRCLDARRTLDESERVVAPCGC